MGFLIGGGGCSGYDFEGGSTRGTGVSDVLWEEWKEERTESKFLVPCFVVERLPDEIIHWSDPVETSSSVIRIFIVNLVVDRRSGYHGGIGIHSLAI